jgi:L-fucose mutarotase
MLKGISPMLSPDLLKVLAEMGHGDEIAIADANFTATTLGHGRTVIHAPEGGVLGMCEAVLSLLPLDEAVAQPVACMQVGDTPQGDRSALQRQLLQRLATAGWARPAQCEALERFSFCERLQRAHAIVQTGELQPYANFLFKKGVIGEVLVA